MIVNTNEPGQPARRFCFGWEVSAAAGLAGGGGKCKNIRPDFPSIVVDLRAFFPGLSRVESILQNQAGRFFLGLKLTAPIHISNSPPDPAWPREWREGYQRSLPLRTIPRWPRSRTSPRSGFGIPSESARNRESPNQ